MWEWLTNSSVWIFIVSAILLALLLVLRMQVRGLALANAILSVLEVITIAVVLVTLTVISISSEGIRSALTLASVQQWLLQRGIRIIIMVIVAVWLWFTVGWLLLSLLRHLMARPVQGQIPEEVKKRADTLFSVFLGGTKAVILIITTFTVLSELNVPIGPILAGFGIAGIAVGFGAQYLVRDIIAGVFILMENQFRVGDVVKIADISGLVEEVHLRKTVLRDLDGVVHHVPNGEIRVASNFTRHYSRVNLNVSVSYGTDLDHAIKVINRVGQELAADPAWRERIITPPQALRVDNLGNSGIEIKIVGDTKPIEQWNVTGELRLRLKKAFDDEGIEIPYQQMTVYFGNPPPRPNQ